MSSGVMTLLRSDLQPGSIRRQERLRLQEDKRVSPKSEYSFLQGKSLKSIVLLPSPNVVPL